VLGTQLHLPLHFYPTSMVPFLLAPNQGTWDYQRILLKLRELKL